MASRTEMLLARLDELMLEADSAGMDPRDLEGWRQRARTHLRLAVGEADPGALDRFDAVRYSPAFFSEDTPDSAFAAARRSGVEQVVAMLAAARDELEFETLVGPEPVPAAMPAVLLPAELVKVEEAVGAVQRAIDSNELDGMPEEDLQDIEVQLRTVNDQARAHRPLRAVVVAALARVHELLLRYSPELAAVGIVLGVVSLLRG